MNLFLIFLLLCTGLVHLVLKVPNLALYSHLDHLDSEGAHTSWSFVFIYCFFYLFALTFVFTSYLLLLDVSCLDYHT